MSIYNCIDDLDEVLKSNSEIEQIGTLKKNQGTTGEIRQLVNLLEQNPQDYKKIEELIQTILQTSRSKNDIKNLNKIRDIIFIKYIRDKLSQLDLERDNNSLQTKLNEIIDDINRHTTNQFENLLAKIKEDLTIVIKSTLPGQEPNVLNDWVIKQLEIELNKLKANPLTHNREIKIRTEYLKLLKSTALISPIRQGYLKELGSSMGQCYGFTTSMADKNLSPYLNQKTDITFNKTIHNYQKSQTNRKLDQEKFTATRLTGNNFCPSLEKQAENIFNIGNNNKEKHLRVTLSDNTKAHATYLNVLNDGQIRYMDPNHGAFLFKDKEDFIKAYQIIYMMDKTKFTRYRVSELKEHNGQHIESNTLRGKFRSLMTELKYRDDHKTVAIPLMLAGGILGTFFCGIIGSIIGSIIFPGLGTAIGGCLGIAIGGSLGPAISYRIGKIAGFNYQGPLNILHDIQDWLHRLKEGTGQSKENQIVPELNLEEKPPVCTQSSEPINTHISNNKPLKKCALIPARPENSLGNNMLLETRDALVKKASENSPLENYETLSKKANPITATNC